MLKERARILAVSIFLLDLILVSAAFLCAFLVRTSVMPRLAPHSFPASLYPLSSYLLLLPVPLLLWGVLLLSSGRYRSHRTVPLLDEAWAIVRVCASGSIIFTLALFVGRLAERLLVDDRVSRFWVRLFGIVACLRVLTPQL